MEPISVVIRANADSPSYVLNGDGTASFAYKLSRDYRLTVPCAVKLLKASGAGKPVVFSTPWVAASDIDGDLLPALGFSLEQANTWRPLRTNYLLAYGWVNFRAVDGSPIKTRKSITLWLVIAPVDDVSLN